MSIVLTIIDDQNGSANPRRERIKISIEKLKFDNLNIVAYPTIKRDNNITENTFEMINESDLIGAGDILLIHSGNKFYREYIEWLNSRTECLVVIYSGGHTNVENVFSSNLVIQRDGGARQAFQLKNPGLVCAIPRPVNSADDLNIVYALKKYCQTRSKDEFFNSLLNFNPLLEAKLELLHICLTPEGAKKVLNGGFPNELESERQKFWEKKLSELNPIIASIEGKKCKELNDIKISELVGKLASGANTKNEYSDCFSESYLTALSALRDALLKEYEHA